MAPKRKAQSQLKQNPLLKLFENIVIKDTTFKYKNYKEWEKFENDKVYEIFKTWYNDYHTKYNHIRHAFNSLCKYHDNLTFTKYDIKIQNKIITSFWNFKYNDVKHWIYQELEGDYNLVAKYDDNDLEILDDDFSSYKFILKKCI